MCVTGVSGADKSTLVNHILHPRWRGRCTAATAWWEHDRIEGLQQVDKVIDIDQSPIGRTPRSNPATYTKVFDAIRDLWPARTDYSRAAACPSNSSNFLRLGGLARWMAKPAALALATSSGRA